MAFYRKHTQETKKKLAEYRKGKNHLEETKLKIAMSLSGGRGMVEVTDISTKSKIGIFVSANEVARNLKSVDGKNLHPSNIRHCLNGKRFQHGGYSYQYVPLEEYNKYTMEN